jgi:hypothetical protein
MFKFIYPGCAIEAIAFVASFFYVMIDIGYKILASIFTHPVHPHQPEAY